MWEFKKWVDCRELLMFELFTALYVHVILVPLHRVYVHVCTPSHEQACISRSARGAVWGVLTCLFVLSRYQGPKIVFACGAQRIPYGISKETVFSLQCFSFGPGAVLGGAYMLVRGLACSRGGVLTIKIVSHAC